MPLIKSSGKKARSKNIATEVKAGRPVKQAVAIAYDVGRKSDEKESKREAAKPNEEEGERNKRIFRNARKLAGM